MDGMEATEHIMAQWSPEDQPYIIAMTGDVTKEARRACTQAGMKGFITKPVRKKELAHVLAQCSIANGVASIPGSGIRPRDASTGNRQGLSPFLGAQV